MGNEEGDYDDEYDSEEEDYDAEEDFQEVEESPKTKPKRATIATKKLDSDLDDSDASSGQSG
jgi:hypothetical protein